MKFFSFWRSLASFRVRIALNLKNLPAEVVFIDLDANAQRGEEYRRVNPQMALPSLVLDDGTVLFQSLAILEYLEEMHPAPPLLPADPRGRARVRGLAQMVACEGHPLLTPRVRRYLDHELNLRDTQQAAWRRHWTVETLAALESHLAGHKAIGRFCHGDTPGMADICLVTHVTAAVNQQIDLAPYPAVKRIFETAMALPEFASAHPSMQPDTPEAMRSKG
ncbi:maleylacetoacetate isomerase [Bradyrhizobium sp. AUGA SZCCT0240]|uniref:maleylacetoacetate isomerase n=1 Tax=unclassified Bradyrhizobium TaxID=2631580 RepID=UPI001BA76F64|nr:MULTISPECIES: maleylacetoacetate isomerase [unclassified Bradyrhizobium]MBR1200087.1 maleylacetoacetate isomerase [Bradyrhizobium sp. AUGA SZCCT0158]MBR1239436.1 maleylacetoacetate isomerase [Bradyrhizobium sp. AUGA SZCCT0274]MBR1256169.1 maleylacetoacetate isomerase [Bradyrhizobium sp. AUGA SZCCT0240]